jgi:hypothetical protein
MITAEDTTRRTPGLANVRMQVSLLQKRQNDRIKNTVSVFYGIHCSLNNFELSATIMTNSTPDHNTWTLSCVPQEWGTLCRPVCVRVRPFWRRMCYGLGLNLSWWSHSAQNCSRNKKRMRCQVWSIQQRRARAHAILAVLWRWLRIGPTTGRLNSRNFLRTVWYWVWDVRIKHLNHLRSLIVLSTKVNNLSFWKFEFSQERRCQFLLLTSIYLPFYSNANYILFYMHVRW